MSLIRMLTTTRSLSDVRDEPSPYRMSGQWLLPKFGPRKKAKAGREGSERRTGDSAPRPQSATAKENLGEGNGDRTDAGCSLKSGSSREPWWRRLFGRKARREPVQAELALDLIRVVRNDLREADQTRNAERGTRKEESGTRKEERPAEESVFGAPRG